MAYMRGDYYLWDDESGLHVWACDGYDGWDQTGWHLVGGGEDDAAGPKYLKHGKNTASGVSIHQEIMDEYVMMRLAEMIQEGSTDAAVDRALGHKGNGGCRVLGANAEALIQALAGLEMRPAIPYAWETVTSGRPAENEE